MGASTIVNDDARNSRDPWQGDDNLSQAPGGLRAFRGHEEGSRSHTVHESQRHPHPMFRVNKILVME